MNPLDVPNRDRRSTLDPPRGAEGGAASVHPHVGAARYFDALAEQYGRHASTGSRVWHEHYFEGRRRLALAALRDLTGGTVADVGAGPGPLTAALTARGCRVVALDRARGMLARARSGGALPVQADAVALPVRDGSCDAAVALGLASYIDDLGALLAELRRIVRPGGVVVVSIARSASPDWIARATLRAPARALGFDGLLTSGLRLHTYRRAAWERAATDAGLAVEAADGHDFTLFPLSRLLPGPSVVIGTALERAHWGAFAWLASEWVVRLRVPGSRDTTSPSGASPAGSAARLDRPARSARVVRVIARLNVGGPAIHTTLTTAGLRPEYETTLATGSVGDGEVEATDLLARFDVAPVRIRGLGRTLSAFDDLRALLELVSLMRRVRPDLVHTHTAKAGALGRIAAWICGVPVVVHTFHGHVLHGYFGRVGSALARWVERGLALVTTRVIAVSDQVAQDLVGLHGVAPAARVTVLPNGLPLDELLTCEEHRGALRRELGIDDTAPVVVFVGRLVPVKEPDVALAVWARVIRERPDARLVMVGAGPLLDALRAQASPSVHWLGWRRDLPQILADADLALLTSRNEGTPIALIEAAAAGVPAVATDVGGVAAVVEHERTGLLAPRGDVEALAAAVLRLIDDAEERRRMGALARDLARERWSAERLIRDLRALYAELGVPGGSRRSASRARA